MNHGVHAVIAADGGDPARARALAEGLGLVCSEHTPERGLVLAVTATRLELRLTDTPAARPVFADFDGPAIRRRVRAGRRSPLARALGLHRRSTQSVLDATCGLGRDAAVLLGLGCRVRAFERSPVLAALVADAIDRLATPPPGWQGIQADDSRDWLQAQSDTPAEVIYIDPMFAEARRNALPKLEMQILRQVAGADADAAELLAAAHSRAGRRVVVKRHPRTAPLAPPDHQIDGKRVCFDVYLTRTEGRE